MEHTEICSPAMLLCIWMEPFGKGSHPVLFGAIVQQSLWQEHWNVSTEVWEVLHQLVSEQTTEERNWLRDWPKSSPWDNAKFYDLFLFAGFNSDFFIFLFYLLVIHGAWIHHLYCGRIFNAKHQDLVTWRHPTQYCYIFPARAWNSTGTT